MRTRSLVVGYFHPIFLTKSDTPHSGSATPGVRSTDAYLHADISIKEKALALTTPTSARPGRYHPSDKVLAFLESL